MYPQYCAVLTRSWRFDLSVTLPCNDFELKFVYYRFYFNGSASSEDCIAGPHRLF